MRRGIEQRQNKPKGWVISGGEYGRRTLGNERGQSLTNEEVPFSLPAVPQTVYKRMVDLSLGMKKTGRTGSMRIEAAKKSEYTYLCRKGTAVPPLNSGELNWDCLPDNPGTSVLLRDTPGRAAEISLEDPE